MAATAGEVIVFENLRHRSSVVGQETEVVKAKATPFSSSNAHGLLREVKNLEDVGELASQAAKKSLAAFRAQ